MSDPDTQRPELPDPQRDRHVAFSDDGPVSGGRPAPKGAFTPGAFTPSLPAEAWAPRPVENTPSTSAPTTSTWQPSVQPGSILTTPPQRPYTPAPRRGNVPLGAKILAGLVLVPLLLGLFSSGSQDQLTYGDDGGTGVEMPVGEDAPGSVYGVWVEPVADTSGVGPALSGKQKTGSVPADAPELRVEVVGADGAGLEVETFAGGTTLGAEFGAGRFASVVHLDQRPTNVQVTATDMAGGTARLQCRVYAGDRLVAINNGTATVTCSLQM